MSICTLLRQTILQKQFPLIDGWQSTLLAQIDVFMPATNESIQIHLVSGNHWVTSSSLSHEVAVYDSKIRRGELSSTLAHQLCLMYRTVIEVEINGSENTGHLIVQFPYTKVEVTVVYLQLHLHCMQQWDTVYQVWSSISWRWEAAFWNALQNKYLPHFQPLINKARGQRKSAPKKLIFIAHVWYHMEIWFNVKPVTNGSISNVFVFSHFPTVMTNGLALLVCEQCVRLIELRFNLFSFSLSCDSGFIYIYVSKCMHLFTNPVYLQH